MVLLKEPLPPFLAVSVLFTAAEPCLKQAQSPGPVDGTHLLSEFIVTEIFWLMAGCWGDKLHQIFTAAGLRCRSDYCLLATWKLHLGGRKIRIMILSPLLGCLHWNPLKQSPLMGKSSFQTVCPHHHPHYHHHHLLFYSMIHQHVWLTHLCPTLFQGAQGGTHIIPSLLSLQPLYDNRGSWEWGKVTGPKIAWRKHMQMHLIVSKHLNGSTLTLTNSNGIYNLTELHLNEHNTAQKQSIQFF